MPDQNPIDTWLLVVSHFCAEVSIRLQACAEGRMAARAAYREAYERRVSFGPDRCRMLSTWSEELTR